MAPHKCCDCFSLQSGAKSLAIIYGLISLAGVCYGIYMLSQSVIDFNLAIGFGSLVPSILMLAVNLMLFIGSHNENRCQILLWLVFNMVAIVMAYLSGLVLLGLGISAVAKPQIFFEEAKHNSGVCDVREGENGSTRGYIRLG